MAATKRKPRGEGHERRPEILQAARRVFGRQGYDRTTMRRVAAEAGVSPAGIYIYFKNKEAILAALRDQTFRELNAWAQEAVARAASPQERLRLHLRSYLEYARAHPDSYRLTFRSQLIRAPRPGRTSNPAEAAGREAFTTLVSEIADLLVPDDPAGTDAAHLAAEAAWAAIHGLSSLVIDVPGFPASGLDAAFDRLVGMVLAGIQSGAAPAATRQAGPVPAPG